MSKPARLVSAVPSVFSVGAAQERVTDWVLGLLPLELLELLEPLELPELLEPPLELVPELLELVPPELLEVAPELLELPPELLELLLLPPPEVPAVPTVAAEASLAEELPDWLQAARAALRLTSARNRPMEPREILTEFMCPRLARGGGPHRANGDGLGHKRCGMTVRKRSASHCGGLSPATPLSRVVGPKTGSFASPPRGGFALYMRAS